MVNIKFEADFPEAKTVSSMRASHVCAIVNEALANTVRHAQASNISIYACDLGEALKVEIKDDGVGIPDDVKNGYGLRNMRDRARLLNGRLEISNHKGTLVTLEIPWND
jgi:two-component system sensor histidine kinase UhpB